MQRFSLLMKIDSKIIAEEVIPFINYYDCENCDEKCDKKCNFEIIEEFEKRGFILAFRDNYQDIEELMRNLSEAHITNFLFLIDNQKDVGYVFQGTGTFQQIKKYVLPEVIGWYEVLLKTDVVLGEIRDVRDVGGLFLLSQKRKAKA